VRLTAHAWFGLAAVSLGAGVGLAVAFIENGTKALVRYNSWDRALSEETAKAKADGIPGSS
jgi:adenosine/AMP kinase